MNLNFDLLEQKFAVDQNPQISVPESGRVFVVSGRHQIESMASNHMLS